MTLEATRTHLGSPNLPRTDHLPDPRARALQRTQPLLRLIVTRRWDVRVHDAVFVPMSGPVILAPNHLGTLDAPMLLASLRRPVYSLAKAELFKGLLGRALTLAGQIPLDRDAHDVGALRRAVAVLRAGEVLAIFPEGVRDGGDFATVRAGLAYLALVTGAPVVPVCLLGTRLPGASRRSMPPARSRVDVVFGHPIAVGAQPFPRPRSAVEDLRAFLAQRLREHTVDAQRRTGRCLPGPVPRDDAVDPRMTR